MLDIDAAMSYVSFVEERHKVWAARQLGAAQPWSSDHILQTRKFTNVFRILDPGTQFIMTDLYDPELGNRDQLMRLFLYRHTGRVEVWQHLFMELGRYPVWQDLDEVLEVWREYRGDAHVRTRNSDPRSAGRTTQTDFKKSIFTSAYLVFPQSQVKGTDKLTSIIDLTKRLFTPESPQDVFPEWMTASTQPHRFSVLNRNSGVGDFMSMQILTDWGYLRGPDREDEFVICGPGAQKGAKALDPTARPHDTLRWAVDALRNSPTCPVLEVHDGVFRKPSYMDAQNTLCEFSKYVRYESKPGTAKPYSPAHPGPQAPPILPGHW